MKNNKPLALLLSIFVSLNCLLLLFSTTVSALTYGSDFSLKYDINSTLDISFSTNTGFIISDLSASNSAYSNTVTITVNSNASDGYVLSATVGKTSDNNRNNNKLVHTNNTNYFEGLATNASVTLSNLGSDKWGYSTYDDTNEVWSNYSGLATVGNTGTTLITSTTPGTKSIDMKIGASASSTQISGTFTNDINFTATANVVTYDYSITYNANNSSTVTNMPTNVSSASFNTGDSVQLSSTTPSASNAISFLGWCDGTVSGTTCTGTLYQPGDYLKLSNPSSSTTNAVSLTGVWELNIITIASGGNLQDIYSKTEGGCPATLTTGQAYTLTDARDGTSYRVARLADGNCWMLDNLALDLTDSSVQSVMYDSSDANHDTLTNADNTTLGYLFNGGGTNNNKWAVSAVTNNWTTYNEGAPTIATSGPCGTNSEYGEEYDDYCVNNPTSGQWSSNSITEPTINGTTSIVQGKIGIYYSYCAASAGSYCYDDSINEAANTNEDICPAGWRLPTANGASGEFYNLYRQYSSASPSQVVAFQTALSTPLTGYCEAHSTSYNQGYEGRFWGSNVSINDIHGESLYAGTLQVRSGNVSAAAGLARWAGASIRCILAD